LSPSLSGPSVRGRLIFLQLTYRSLNSWHTLRQHSQSQ